jgi:hypothetical protein
MITFGYDEASGSYDEDKTRQVFTRAVPKVLLLRGDLAVGMSGADLTWTARQLIGMRNDPVDDVLGILQEFDDVDFLAAHLSPGGPRLWRATRGALTEFTNEGRTWVGDQPAYETYLRLYAGFPAAAAVDWRMLSSMQGLVNVYRSTGVGGFILRVATGPAGFCFVPAPAQVLGGNPAGLGQTDAFAVLAGLPASHSGYQIQPAVGRPPTAGALGFVIPQVRRGWLFPHDEPWSSKELQVDSAQELVVAAATLGQTLTL